MRNQLLFAIVVIFSAPALAKTSARVIYGDDNRRDYFEVPEASWRDRADSTVALIRAAKLTVNGDLTAINTVGYGQSLGLCTNEPFYAQETAAFCSGFLVTPDTIVTAGHCVRSQSSCESVKFVFGFKVLASVVQPRSVPNEYVFSCKQLVYSVAEPSGEDFAVIQARSSRFARSTAPFRAYGQPDEGSPLVVIGHPSGLPLKVADGGVVRKIKSGFMVTNLDTYAGNSGSAVFNGVTGQIEGILVRGEMDFVYKDGCRQSNRCDTGACRGEDVTLFERVIPYL